MQNAKRKSKRARPKKPEPGRFEYCNCPNCGERVVCVGKKVICDYCNAIFVMRSEKGAQVLRLGVKKEIVKPKRKKRGRGLLAWFE